MFEWSVSLGAALTMGFALLGFGGTLIYNAFVVGKYAASTDERLKELAIRMGDLEKAESKMTDILVQMAQSKTEMQLLSKRIDDVQQHGSYKLAEIMDNMRRQIMMDLRDYTK